MAKDSAGPSRHPHGGAASDPGPSSERETSAMPTQMVRPQLHFSIPLDTARRPRARMLVFLSDLKHVWYQI